MADMPICSAHGKRRTAQNLMDDGMGGLTCSEGNECQTGTQGSGQLAGGNYGTFAAPRPMTGAQLMGGGGGTFTAGDWNCPACGDHQFARNTQCRKCGAPNPNLGAGGGAGAGAAAGGQAGVTPAMNMMMMAMMAQNGGAAAGGMAGMGGMQNTAGMSAAELEIARLEADMAKLQNEINGGGPGAVMGMGMAGMGGMGGRAMPTSGLVMKKTRMCQYFEKGMCTKGGECTFAHGPEEMGQPQIPGMQTKPAFTGTTFECTAHGRSRTLPNLMEDGAGGYRCAPGFECQTSSGKSAKDKGQKGAMMAGDWNCPGCGDHQFARNTECRKCGTPNPTPPMGKGATPY